jgi:uncharacterized protein with PIN domain
MAQPPRFFVDAMLGNLVRDLRLLGFDAALAHTEPDARILRRCQAEGRILVTRDRGLARRCGALPCVLVEGPDQAAQVRAILETTGGSATPTLPLSRCLKCNGVLRPLTPEAARREVPDFVALTHERFLGCPGCGGVFWEGSHACKLRALVKQLRKALLAPTGHV